MLFKSLVGKLSKLAITQTVPSVALSSSKASLLTKFVNNALAISKFSTTSLFKNETQTKLMQFFDDKKNWTEEKVKHGKTWSMDELRLKSNTDLHKLWYVLHKERNMLLSMEEIYGSKALPMPSHERIAKVKYFNLIKQKIYFEIKFIINDF